MLGNFLKSKSAHMTQFPLEMQAQIGFRQSEQSCCLRYGGEYGASFQAANSNTPMRFRHFLPRLCGMGTPLPTISDLASPRNRDFTSCAYGYHLTTVGPRGCLSYNVRREAIHELITGWLQ